MNIACGTVTFRQYPLQEALQRIKAAGYEYAEPQATAPPTAATLPPGQTGPFSLYFNDSSLYIQNLSGQDINVNSLAFERLESDGSPSNRGSEPSDRQNDPLEVQI